MGYNVIIIKFNHMSKKILSNQPVKGASDWFPEEFALRQYIFSTWRQVCLRYGFLEYLTPALESADVYRAKSGEDVGQKELMVFVDQGGRELALRPEMTPSVTRMVSRYFEAAPKPLRLFSIANFFRNERPQRGRNREFWQLNCDTFGSDNLNADIEILSLVLDLVLAFNPPANSFELRINNRNLIDGLLDAVGVKEDNKLAVVRILDKYLKLSADDFILSLSDLKLTNESIDKVVKFMTAASAFEVAERLPELKENPGLKEIEELMRVMSDLGYGQYLSFNASVIRGFDYYDGLVFEVFDNHADNNRAMFGGGRYNGLADIFGEQSFPAVGFGLGDETFKLFLESWGLLPDTGANREVCFAPLLSEDLAGDLRQIVAQIRSQGKSVLSGLEPMKIGKALEFADKHGFAQFLIYGSDEAKRGVYKLKSMFNGREDEMPTNL